MKPIIFNTEMVRAILDGRKTVTRRVVKPKYRNDEGGFQVCWQKNDPLVKWVEKTDEDECSFDPPRYVNPPYQTGDILYVRETWNYGYFDSSDAEYHSETWFEAEPRNYDGIMSDFCHYVYKADYTKRELSDMGVEHDDGSYRVDWRPSIHMPKEAARLFLRVMDVRVERLQDITISDLQDEGVLPNGYVSQYAVMTTDCFDTFKALWDSTIKPKDREMYGWEANPWVWIIEFKRISKEEAKDNA